MRKTGERRDGNEGRGEGIGCFVFYFLMEELTH